MKIIYKNYRGGEYHTFWSPINGCRPKRIIGFRQKQPNGLSKFQSTIQNQMLCPFTQN